MDTRTIAELLTLLTFAAVPWAIAQPVTRFNPRIRTRNQRRAYRVITAAGAVAASGNPFTWLLAVIAAAVLTARWATYRRRQLRAARKAAELGYTKVVDR